MGLFDLVKPGHWGSPGTTHSLGPRPTRFFPGKTANCPHRFGYEPLETRTMLTANWGVDAVDAPEVWNRGYTGQGVVVAVIDAGLEPHQELLPNLWSNPHERMNSLDDDNNGYLNDLNGWDFTDNDNNPLTKTRHGNHVLGIIAADDNDVGVTGIAHDAQVMPLRVFDDQGNSSTQYVANAIRLAVDNGADIINLSVGGIASSNIEAAIRHANEHDVLIVASAGNAGEDKPSFPASSSSTYPNVLSVGAHDANFHHWAGTNAVGDSGAIQVDAPGVDVRSTSINGGYGTGTGTSSAAAHAAGVAALVLSGAPDLTAGELRDALVAGATQRVSGSDARGAINARRSVDLVVGTSTERWLPTADFNGNGRVDFADFMRLSQNFGQRGKAHADGDADRNGTVDFYDFLTLAQSFSRPVSQTIPPPPPPAAIDVVMQETSVEAKVPRPPNPSRNPHTIFLDFERDGFGGGG